MNKYKITLVPNVWEDDGKITVEFVDAESMTVDHGDLILGENGLGGIVPECIYSSGSWIRVDLVEPETAETITKAFADAEKMRTDPSYGVKLRVRPERPVDQ